MMPTQIQKWKAVDGSEWDSEAKAAERESLIAAVKQAMAPLGNPPKDDGCRFANGEGYIQHAQETVVQVRLALYEISKPYLKWWYDKQKENFGATDWTVAIETHTSWHSRMLDGSYRPLDQAFCRLCCIDKSFREWGQPYFASHPSEGKQFEVQRT